MIPVALFLLSIGLQLAAAVIALLLIRDTGRTLAWVLLALAILLMAWRRIVTFAALLSSGKPMSFDLPELIALAISVLMFAGVSRIGSYFRTIRLAQAERESAMAALSRSEERFRASEQYIRTILDTVDEGFIVVDRDYRVMTANKAYCSMTGRALNDVIGGLCHEMTHRNCRPCSETGVECVVKRVFETGTPHGAVHRHPGPDGRMIVVETKAFPIRDDAGRITSAIETLSDVTERHLLEEERLKIEKLKSIGTLAGGIAHDFNNLLQGIFGYISMARQCIDQKDKALGMIEQAEKALHQAVSLATQLLTFSKGGKPVRRPLSPGPLIEDAVKFALSGSRTEFHLALEPDLWRVNADSGQLGQVIQNIVINADQAMPQGGRLEVAARNALPSDPDLPQDLPRRSYVVVSIRDSGAGIPEKNLDKIFDPYFTTKETGSGLGLATAYSIVKNHEGRIAVSSEPGKGSTFVLWLPAAESAATPQEEAAIPQRTRGARVLVMDDEELIRNLAGEMLSVLGHTCALADRGETAIEVYRAARSSNRPFDVVILDLTIRGGMGGWETLGKLREIDPAVKAVASSGYSDETADPTLRERGFSAFLKKPYNSAELQRTLNLLLG